MRLRHKLPEGRTYEQIKNHYEVEKRLADKLLHTKREERSEVLRAMYEELFRAVPDHSRLTRQKNLALSQRRVKSQVHLVRKYVDASSTVGEFAPGDCAFCLEMSKHAKFVYGIDISDQRVAPSNFPENFQLIIYDGYHVDLPPQSLDVMFSDQLIEHIHPEDTPLHFQMVAQLLKPGGRYIFRTPHRFSGPHDISRFFSDTPEGFHLKEWTYTELSTILDATFGNWHAYWGSGKSATRFPNPYFVLSEKMVQNLQPSARRYISAKLLPNITVVATKCKQV
jgi:SAM-dependent methyltransferase